MKNRLNKCTLLNVFMFFFGGRVAHTLLAIGVDSPHIGLPTFSASYKRNSAYEGCRDVQGVLRGSQRGRVERLMERSPGLYYVLAEGPCLRGYAMYWEWRS